MSDETGTEGLHAAADRVSAAASHVRELAADALSRSDSEPDGKAEAAADVLGNMSHALEAVAESARASGFVIRDRGRDAARALSRGERALRETGLPGAAVGTAMIARRNAGKIAAASAGVMALLLLRRGLSED